MREKSSIYKKLLKATSNVKGFKLSHVRALCVRYSLLFLYKGIFTLPSTPLSLACLLSILLFVHLRHFFLFIFSLGKFVFTIISLLFIDICNLPRGSNKRKLKTCSFSISIAFEKIVAFVCSLKNYYFVVISFFKNVFCLPCLNLSKLKSKSVVLYLHLITSRTI